MPGTFSRPLRISDPDMHHGMCVTHVPWYMPGSLSSGFLRSRCREKRSRHSRRMRKLQFYYLTRGPFEWMRIWCNLTAVLFRYRCVNELEQCHLRKTQCHRHNNVGKHGSPLSPNRVPPTCHWLPGHWTVNSLPHWEMRIWLSVSNKKKDFISGYNPANLLLNACQGISLMNNRYWARQWPSAVSQQAITCYATIY